MQAYIVRNIGKRINITLDGLLSHSCTIEWIGNEVSCGVGMQRIDVMLSVLDDGQRIVIPIELKACQASESNVIQIQRYVDWVEQYYIPNRQSDIQPTLIARRITDKNSPNYRTIIQSFNGFNSANQNRCGNLKYVEYDVADNSIDFREVQY